LKVAVIGSSGGMGKFFAKYFLSRGSRVTGSDLRRSAIRHRNFTFSSSNRAAVKGADVVVIATPADTTVATVAEIAPGLSQKAVLIEITSVKAKVLDRVKRELAGRGSRLLSLHPLFGPSLESYTGMKICVIDTGASTGRLAHALFPEALLIPMGEKEHDSAMALILSLTHLLNIAYAGAVSRYMKPGEFRKVQTPTSGVQLTLAEGILSQSPALYSYIQTENPYSAEAARAVIEELGQLLVMVEKDDRRGFERRFRELSRAFSGDSEEAVGLVYQAFEKSSR
jgi:prephenate dehydrogenase